MAEAAKLDVDWVFWSEDDYEYRRRVPVEAIVRVMEEEGDDLKQMVLRRQPVFPAELDAGGMIERFDPDLFRERTSPDGTWIEHRVFFSLNPHLISRRLLEVLARKWPERPNSEHLFGVTLFAKPLPRCGIWGAKADPPWVLHDPAAVRTGTGY
jgi:hypothetical protein